MIWSLILPAHELICGSPMWGALLTQGQVESSDVVEALGVAVALEEHMSMEMGTHRQRMGVGGTGDEWHAQRLQ